MSPANLSPELDSQDRQALAEAGGLETAASEKVELDRADLPLFSDEQEQPEESGPAVEVDLAGEAGEGLLAGEDEEEEPPPRSRAKRLAGWSVLLGIAVGLGLGLWYGLLKGEATPKAERPPWYYQGPMPDPARILRVDLEPFLVPLLESKEGRILRVAVSLESPDQPAKDALGDKTRLLRDVIYRLLRDRPAAEIKTYRGKKLLQAQIKTELNHVLERKLVYQVLFTEFVITG
jgi:flagellar basal body-associated protein FliL